MRLISKARVIKCVVMLQLPVLTPVFFTVHCYTFTDCAFSLLVPLTVFKNISDPNAVNINIYLKSEF